MQKYRDVIIDTFQRPVSGGSVLVRPTGSSATAAIFGDSGGTATRANPLATDTLGEFWFYGTNGRYDFVINGGGIDQTTKTDVMLEDVPLTNLGELSTASNARTSLGLGSAAVKSTAAFFQPSLNLSEVTTAADARANLGLAIGTNVPAFNTNAAFTTGSQTFTGGQRGAVVALASTGQIAPDFGASNNFSLALSANTTLAAPTNVQAGQSGSIQITQNATSKTLAMATFYKWGGTATGTVSTATGTIDVLNYYCYSTSAAVCNIINGVG